KYVGCKGQEGRTVEQWLRRPEIDWASLCEMNPGVCDIPASSSAIEQVQVETKYAGFIERQAAQIERFHKLETRPIPAHFDFAAVPQLRFEAKEKLGRIRPTNLGQASRISGITPADLSVLLLYLHPS